MKQLVVVTLVMGLAACGGGGESPSPQEQADSRSGILASRNGSQRERVNVRVDLRVDSNRDGVVDMRGDSDTKLKDRSPALFLANLDDSSGRCSLPAQLFTTNIATSDNTTWPAYDLQLAACNDAQDEIVNGPEDEKDLAVIRSMPLPSARADGQLVVSGAPETAVRLFLRDGALLTVFNPRTQTIPARLLRQGVELRLEGRDILRNSAWDGSVKLTLRVAGAGEDTVTLQQAPLLLQHNLQPMSELLVSKWAAQYTPDEFFLRFPPGYGLSYDNYVESYARDTADYGVYRASLENALRVARRPLRVLDMDNDTWMQDLFEPGFMSMPGVSGPRVMRVFLRSANLGRRGARGLFLLRGPGVAVVHPLQETSIEPPVDFNLNNLGNLDTVPPYENGRERYANGRILIGSSASRQPDTAFVELLRAQGAQPPIEIDTSWLLVGHVDEMLQVVPSPNKRGWTLAVADPRLAVRLLRDAQARGAGGALLFAGRPIHRLDDTAPSAQTTVDEILAFTELLASNETAARHLDREIGRLVRLLGLEPRDLVRLPVLFRSVGSGDSFWYTAHSPNLANGVLLSRQVFALPDPAGPVVDGQDIFLKEAARALARVGVRPVAVDVWSIAHVRGGALHCQTNALRSPGKDAAWWAGRSLTSDRD